MTTAPARAELAHALRTLEEHDMPSTQPTHHGYAVNVKDYTAPNPGWEIVPSVELERAYNIVQEDFWTLAQDVAQAHGFAGVYSEGRMGGWAQPYPQPSDERDDRELAHWMAFHFRPFERDIFELMESAQEDFRAWADDLAASAEREPAERAYWAARDTITVEA